MFAAVISSATVELATPFGASRVQPSAYPNSIIVLGDSGATGLHSDPDQPEKDATQNSWATGDNPAVKSIYTRVLALHPAVRGHNANVAVDGTGVDQLGGQVDQALAIEPRPDLFLIQTVANDIRCDGSDPDNYALFAVTLEDVLRKISVGAPQAKVFIVSGPWSTTKRYLSVAQHLPGARASNTGTGPCDLFSPAGEPVPAHQRYIEGITQRYLDAVKSVCAKFRTCLYDHGALHNIAITTADVTPDGYHLTVIGQRKQAALEWRALALKGSRS
ncbi:MAG: GDSL-type esterase/lipase family protein [Actinomycetota bacterium]|nr:GDSL-type esterase/lipase family protein [Actinomycetota bacterium]